MINRLHILKDGLISWSTQTQGRRRWFEYLWQLAFALALSTALPLLDYTRQDIIVSYASEIWLMVVVHWLITLVLFSLYYATLKSKSGRLLATIATVVVLMQHYPRLISYASQLTSWATSLAGNLTVSLAVIVGAWLLVWLVEQYVWPRWHKTEQAVYTLLRFVCLVVLIYNGGQFVLTWWRSAPTTAYRPAPTTTTLQASQPARDIYYLVFDDYSNNQSLKQYMNFDNSQISDYLRGQGFDVHDNMDSNYQTTAPSVASTLRMGYNTDIASQLGNVNTPSSMPYVTLLRNAPVDTLLKQAGYATYLFGAWWNPTRLQNNATTINPDFQADFLGHTSILSELQSNALKRTFLWPILQQGMHIGSFSIAKVYDADPGTLFLNQVNRLKSLITTSHSQPRFVFAHFLNPHSPYVFTADGKQAPPGTDGTDAGYVGQVQFANSIMEQLVSLIKKNASTDPIIIIQSDEGRPIDPPDQWQNASADNLKYKFGTFAAYDLPGLPADATANITSPVNTFRTVFNDYFGTNFSYLPACSFVFNWGSNPYKFYDITSKLHPEMSSCKAYQ